VCFAYDPRTANDIGFILSAQRIERDNSFTKKSRDST
jgi:hypothetical protein